MKNILLKSVIIFVVMSCLNAQLAHWSGRILKLSAGQLGMLPTAVFFGSLIITVIASVTIVIFRRSYQSLWKSAILFEILYLVMLLLSGINPLIYFIEATDNHLIDLMLYINSIIVFLLMYLFDLLYSKILGSKIKN
ncbi:hypothetical protein EG346_10205 [Chryseobacterium carnipullorum]|uniref:Uncharacterized protein n=1 Tax=Chryseobacterium carnipullorum TaxID=1124835 RepID=A0A376DQ63_CHRCU|nr:hypothetical protein [Chryseobacterium carnipullorum]AZA48534.1 hypothetical protein EG346_10205 [Chryseobacterium carnipullorum]AZA63459.1 hypothetical protein EG345_01105 [Chryseobacterium carnipullorum]STC92613.1 Uncharacterised protein [Chryseobacterium carnipullorum]